MSDASASDQHHAPASIPPPPAVIHLPGVVGSYVLKGWVNPQSHKPNCRNAAIVKRVPFLLNVVGPEVVALLLLHWYRCAPAGMFKDDERTHWSETWAHIRACVASWPTHQGRFPPSDLERKKYLSLATNRQRDAFRICRSLSLTKANLSTRIFFLSGRDCGDRLMIPSKAGERQLEYLVKAGVIEVALAGATWSKGHAPAATRYRWRL